ncbi:hypothetical protein [Halomonas casei]|uniref:hypothetical protein n=1 Tax=Halomonas casei TaxID=2742613 RepID=UPI003CED8411
MNNLQNPTLDNAFQEAVEGVLAGFLPDSDPEWLSLAATTRLLPARDKPNLKAYSSAETILANLNHLDPDGAFHEAVEGVLLGLLPECDPEWLSLTAKYRLSPHRGNLSTNVQSTCEAILVSAEQRLLETQKIALILGENQKTA